MKISLELRRASDEAVLWGPQVYDREVKDVFAIHSEIAGEVARVLQARERQGTFAGAQFMTKNPRANELFARLQNDYDKTSSLDRAFVYAWTGDRDRAIAEYQRLIGVAWSGLNIHHMKRAASFAPVRDDPRFQALLADPKNTTPLF